MKLEWLKGMYFCKYNSLITFRNTNGLRLINLSVYLKLNSRHHKLTASSAQNNYLTALLEWCRRVTKAPKNVGQLAMKVDRNASYIVQRLGEWGVLGGCAALEVYYLLWKMLDRMSSKYCRLTSTWARLNFSIAHCFGHILNHEFSAEFSIYAAFNSKNVRCATLVMIYVI